MTHLRTPTTSPLYDRVGEDVGYVPNFLRPFALQPGIHSAWESMLSTIKSGMTPLRYELVALAAARALNSRYCVLAHTAVVRDGLLNDPQLIAALTAPRDSGLPPAEVAVIEFATRIATEPSAATPAALDVLRNEGLSEEDIFHVVAAVAARQFFTTVLAATGTEPDDHYDDLDPALRTAILP
ncbi:carboxymuconolactone decarboxylase family protein [Actinoplanes couchii]|uniref:Alkyl hydroperoxide reductase AhpD n=1 Tax=Actinoplanes couchii TaxID=403638 RepID=A0ABQ3X173_9ACTN|nr:peroxidase [Actinoplanes couchii]MDR6316585.1 putative peroxidase-related enzyme [Actinoplanes couchii]GID52199.1 alkyl hydroperoxide reductase AhpD [Actinoplanes couchii]